MKMPNLFKSRYRVRIENKIIELTEEIAFYEGEKYKKRLNPAGYSTDVMLQDKVKKNIEILESLL